MTADDHLVECWCCGSVRPPDSVVRLGNHPEVALCLQCAHFVHQQAWVIEDAWRPTLGSRLRAVPRAVRAVVIRHGWAQQPVIGRPLRWLGRRLP